MGWNGKNEPMSIMGGVTETVGDYLARPVGASPLRRVDDFCVCACLVCWALAALIFVFQGRVFADLGVFSAESIDLGEWQWPLAVAGCAFCVLGVVFHVIEKAGKFAKYDAKEAAKKGVLAVMVGKPRFGISLSTPMNRVALSVDYLGRGAGVEGVRVRNGVVPFLADDFRGCRGSDFGGIDFELVDGALFVFITMDAKKRWVEKMRSNSNGR